MNAEEIVEVLRTLGEVVALRVASAAWNALPLDVQAALTLDEDFWKPGPRRPTCGQPCAATTE